MIVSKLDTHIIQKDIVIMFDFINYPVLEEIYWKFRVSCKLSVESFGSKHALT